MMKTLREYKLSRIGMVSVTFWPSSRVDGKCLLRIILNTQNVFVSNK